MEKNKYAWKVLKHSSFSHSN